MFTILIGSAPHAETLAQECIAHLLQAAVFLRQLNRARPILPESGMRYAVIERRYGYIVGLTGMTEGFDKADLAHELAINAQEIDLWDAQALAELAQYGLVKKVDSFEQALKYA